MSVPILILAGGSSSRMGDRHKLLEEVQGRPLLRLQAWRAMKASQDVTVLLRPGMPALRDALDGLNLRILEPDAALEGMGGSIRAGTEAMLNAPAFLMLLADLVDIEAEDMRAIIASRTPKEKIWIRRGATEDGKPGHPILFEEFVYRDLLQLSGDEGGQSVVKRHKDKVKLIPLPGQRARTDLDNPEDWAAWRAANTGGQLIDQDE